MVCGCQKLVARRLTQAGVSKGADWLGWEPLHVTERCMSQRAALSACTTSTRRLDLRASLAASGVACDRAANETSMRLGHLIGGAGVNFDGRELDDTHCSSVRGGARA